MLCYMYASIVYVQCGMECMYMYTNIYVIGDRMTMLKVQILNEYEYVYI